MKNVVVWPEILNSQTLWDSMALIQKIKYNLVMVIP